MSLYHVTRNTKKSTRNFEKIRVVFQESGWIIFLKYSGGFFKIPGGILFLVVFTWTIGRNMLISSCHDFFRVGFVKSPGGFCQNSMRIFSKVRVNFSKIHVNFLKSPGGYSQSFRWVLSKIRVKFKRIKAD